MTSTEHSDARAMDATGLLEAAARLVERAIIQLNVSKTECLGCGGQLFENRTHAKVYERITNTPDKLRDAAELLRTGSDGLFQKARP